jgi:hypothetical protein
MDGMWPELIHRCAIERKANFWKAGYGNIGFGASISNRQTSGSSPSEPFPAEIPTTPDAAQESNGQKKWLEDFKVNFLLFWAEIEW